MSAITQLHSSSELQSLMQEVDSAKLAQELGANGTAPRPAGAVSRLRVAAYLSLAEIIGEQQVDGLLRQFAAEADTAIPNEGTVAAYQKWSGFLKALQESGELIALDDLFLFATIGLLARQPIEVRSFLRQPLVREVVVHDMATDEELSWFDRVRSDISRALLLLIRQETREDVAMAGLVIQQLATDQQRLEVEWLHSQANPRRDAISLLGLYHLAQAVIRLSEFLLAGSVETDGRVVTDFAAELRRLLIRAEEYLSLSSDVDTRFWLNAVATTLWRLRSDSIWVTGKGISERLDKLLEELSRTGRQRPVFSLMPSQQDALRQNLLDAQKIAVVLQMPTSAGKTLLAEFSIVQAFETYKEKTRVAYVVPTRALATQIRRTLAEDLGPLGIQVAAAGSAFEEDPYELNLLLSADGVVVATPEKLDLLLRAHPSWFETLRLIVVDEAHLLQDGDRGVRLELLLANIRRERPQARLLLLTPFVDNARQIATWLGGARGLSITVQWRPSRLLLGIANIAGGGSNRALTIEWRDPNNPQTNLKSTRLRENVSAASINTTTKKITHLAPRFLRLGVVLALYAASPADAEESAASIAKQRELLPSHRLTPGMRVAIALARDEYGKDSQLAASLERGIAFHHSSLSPILRYLIEDQVRAGTIDFIAATTTLAQGMNFPVAAVLVHSVHKPYGSGSLTAAEFWNIAGRAGRVGLVDKGLVVFVNRAHTDHFERYSRELTQPIRSALLSVLRDINQQSTLKDQYAQHKELRPFIQYLAHAAANDSPTQAIDNLDELLQASLANVQVADNRDAQMLRSVARRYLREISSKSSGYLKAADTTGLGSFSFDELYARIGDNPTLRSGPQQILSQKQDGLFHLIDILRRLPELSLAIGLGEGQMSVEAVARVVQGWMDGKTISELATEFRGETGASRIREAARYIYGTVSQTVSWGAHAYLRGWSLRQPSGSADSSPADVMLGAYIQYGVNTPEAAVASLLGVPRQFAEPFGAAYRERNGELSPQDTPAFKNFVEQAGNDLWDNVTARSTLAGKVAPEDVRVVWRQMQGLI